MCDIFKYKESTDYDINEQKWIELQSRELEKQKKQLMSLLEKEFEKQKQELWVELKEEADKRRKDSWDQLKKEHERRNSELINQLNTRLEKFYEMMRELGWPPHGEMNVAEAKRIVEADIIEKEELENMINDYYLRKFNVEVVSSFLVKWKENKIIEKRIPILEQAISAHISGNYFLSVCVLLSQLEGIIAYSESHTGQMRGSQMLGYLDKAIPENDAYDFGYAYKKFFIDKIYCGFKHGERIGSPISRHAILHGADVDFGTEVNSLKAILIFDNLLYFFTKKVID